MGRAGFFFEENAAQCGHGESSSDAWAAMVFGVWLGVGWGFIGGLWGIMRFYSWFIEL